MVLLHRVGSLVFEDGTLDHGVRTSFTLSHHNGVRPKGRVLLF